jgi:hypothetical protein
MKRSENTTASTSSYFVLMQGRCLVTPDAVIFLKGEPAVWKTQALIAVKKVGL